MVRPWQIWAQRIRDFDRLPLREAFITVGIQRDINPNADVRLPWRIFYDRHARNLSGQRP
jgi:hypothetical protein